MIVAEPRVPYYDLPRRVDADRAALKAIVREVARSGEYILKRRVAGLEDELAAFTGARHAIGTASGTAAIHLGLAALGAGPGDEVITPAFSFHSSATPIAHLGATPVLVDVTEDTALLDADRAAAAVTERTAGVVAVHLFSAMADMPSLRALARDRGLWILEDSAIALGMRWDGVPAGRWGDLGLYSFHPYKPLGGISDGAALMTDDDDLARRCRMLRNHGQDGVQRFVHHVVGFNARMDEVNAAFLARRLARYRAGLARRAEIARRYDGALGHLAPELRIPPPVAHERIHYTYVVRVRERDALERHLAARGVETVVYYPLPLHLQPVFAHLGHRAGDFPNAERASRESLALPLYPEMPDDHVEEAIAAVLAFWDG